MAKYLFSRSFIHRDNIIIRLLTNSISYTIFTLDMYNKLHNRLKGIKKKFILVFRDTIL